MSNLRLLKNKISTVKSVKKIFSVMQLIAASKMKRAQNELETSQKIVASAAESFQSLNGFSNLIKNTATEPIYIILASDKGLCGNYNNLILRKCAEVFSDRVKKTIVIFGKKISQIINKRYPGEVSKFFDFDTQVNNESELVQYAKSLIELIKTEKLSSCYIIYVKSKNSISRNAVCEIFIDKILKDENLLENETKILEPNYKIITQGLYEFYLVARFINFFKNAKFSELTSRIIAMDSATRNAKEIETNLTLRYNKQRQAKITSDLIDIINGAENG